MTELRKGFYGRLSRQVSLNRATTGVCHLISHVRFIKLDRFDVFVDELDAWSLVYARNFLARYEHVLHRRLDSLWLSHGLLSHTVSVRAKRAHQIAQVVVLVVLLAFHARFLQLAPVAPSFHFEQIIHSAYFALILLLSVLCFPFGFLEINHLDLRVPARSFVVKVDLSRRQLHCWRVCRTCELLS